MQHNLGHLLARAHERADRWLVGRLEAAGLSALAPSHGDVLACLFERGEATMHELAEFAHRTKPTMTVLVDKLAAAGFVVREKSGTDARSTVVRLTPEGEALRPAFREISEDLRVFLCNGLTSDEAGTLARLLQKTLTNPESKRKIR